jgi:GNAT superfamily N-acetyltransferase
MIRKLQKTDINQVSHIWLNTNLKAHFFIPEQYWISNYEFVKEMLPQSEVYVYENNNKIQGFIGLKDDYIEGIFVADEMQSHGIGKKLLDYIKNKKAKLQLNEGNILKSINEAKHGKSIVLVSHRKSTAKIADEAYTVYRGRLS